MHTFIRRALALSLVAILLVALPVPAAVAAPRATGISVDSKSVSIDLASGSTHMVSASVLPSGASQRMIWATRNKRIATVTNKGLITAKAVGTVKIGVRPYGIKKWTTITLKVTDSLRPTSLSVPKLAVTIGVGETYDIVPSLKPSTASQEVNYSVDKPSIAKVTSTGVVTGVKSGTARVRVRAARNSSASKTITVKVAKAPAPKNITILPDDKSMSPGAKLQLSASVSPEGASSSVGWKSSNTKIATVSSAGLVTAKAEGTVKITATSKAKATVSMTRTLTVVDPDKPTAIKFVGDDVLYFPTKSAYTLVWAVEPEGARRDASFKSSNTSIVSVDANGVLNMKDDGVVTITATATGTKLTATIKIVVLNADRTTILPDRTSTDESQIKANLAKIDAIQKSAQNELVLLEGTGVISPGEAKLRREAVAEAFINFGFAWKTDKKVTYWTSKLPQNNYKPGTIYYGMPYIQNGANQDYTNRRFTLSKSTAQGYFKSINNSSRFYTMTDKRLSQYYVGNDCSSFVSMAVWGMNHAASFYNTTSMAKSIYYQTITGGTNMRTGDLMVKSSSHTIMFLYYVDAAKTQMMLIENGGLSVSCKVANVATYLGQGYSIKRPVKYTG